MNALARNCRTAARRKSGAARRTWLYVSRDACCDRRHRAGSWVLIGPRVLNYLSESKVKAAKIQMQSFASALDLFNLDTGRYPSSAEGLAGSGSP